MNKLGLVLSGGGAKGAYEVGVIKYLSERNFKIDAISGASIGSLNGAIIASSDNLEIASEKLHNVWKEVCQNPPIDFDKLDVNDESARNTMLLMIKFLGITSIFNNFIIFKNIFNLNEENGFFSNATTRQYIQNNIDFDKFQTGLPFYVSVYESEGSINDILKLIFKSSKSSDYIKIQDNKNKDDIINILLASSALPIIFSSVKIDNKNYRDGGLGDSYKIWGNTPIIPLIEKEKCDTIIVVHLSDGSLWERHDFKSTNIIEIRPQTPIKRKGFVDMIAFNEYEINSWIKQGYDDAKIIIDKIAHQFDNINSINSENIKLNNKIRELRNQEFYIK